MWISISDKYEASLDGHIRTHYIPRNKHFGAKPLAKKFGVAHQTISAAACGQNFKELRLDV